MRKDFALENFFDVSYPKPQVPQTWQVIYHEAMRNNHIIFSSEDMIAIDKALSVGGFRLSPEDQKKILEVGSYIFNLSHLPEIMKTLRALSISQKSAFFLLYKRTLNRWRSNLKDSLN